MNFINFTSDNFECGCFSVLLFKLRFMINYYLIVIHFLLLELELIIIILFNFGSFTSNESILLGILLVLLFFDLLSIL